MCAKIYPPLSSTLCKISSAVELTKALTTTLIRALPSVITVPSRVNAINNKEGINQQLNEEETMIAKFDMKSRRFGGSGLLPREKSSQKSMT